MTEHRPDPAGLDLVVIPTYRDAPATPTSDLAGVDLSGRELTVAVTGVERWTLLLFLSSRCDGCQAVWRVLSESAGGWPEIDDVVPVVVTRGPDSEGSAELRRWATDGVPLLMSDAAYRAYRVHGPPFFVLVDGYRSRVATEGVAWGPAQIADDVRRARAGAGGPAVPRLRAPER